MHRKLTHHSKRIARRVTTFRKSSKLRQMVEDFADRSGMVYFGFVSQMSDEHRMVRGLTVSTKHQDHHYCVGTYHDYDVVFVERTDTLLTSGHEHVWHILEFDLHTNRDLPHLFIGSTQHGKGFHSLLSAKYSSMIPLPLGHVSRYPKNFTDHFSVYSVPAEAMGAERIVDPETAEKIGSHFKGLVAEVIDGSLYIYSEKSHLTPSLLDTMMANGLWLARHIDEKSQLL